MRFASYCTDCFLLWLILQNTHLPKKLMIIAYRCSERGPSLPRDKNSPRWNTEANLEPGVPFCEHERIRRHQRTPDEQFLARLTACGRYTLFQLRQRHMWHPIPKGLWSHGQQADHDSTRCKCSFPLQNPFSPRPRPLHPALLHPLLCERCSHHSPPSVILGTGKAVLSAFVSRYYSSWLSLLCDSDCIEGPFCQALQFRTVPGHFLSKVHNSLWLKKERESIFKQP